MKLYEVSVDPEHRDSDKRIKIEEHEIVKETEKMWAIQNGNTVKRYHKNDEDVIKSSYLSHTAFRFYSLDEDVARHVIKKGLMESVLNSDKHIELYMNKRTLTQALLSTLEGSK